MSGPYSIDLLNDLHHHFPDLLYHSDQFTTVSSVLNYVVRVARRDAFEHARSTAQMRAQAYRMQQEAAEQQAQQQRIERMIYYDPIMYWEDPSPPISIPVAPAAPRATTESIFSDFLNALLPQLRPQDPISVPAQSVRAPSAGATTEQLETGTLMLHAIQASECAICQDMIEIGESIRMIRHCTHRFHQSCIDPWLQSHSTCPTCRHDLRSDNIQ